MDGNIPQNPESPKTDPAARKPSRFEKTQPSQRARKPRGFKIALLVLLGLFVIGAAALYFLPLFLPLDTIRSMANSQAKQYGLNVDFSSLGFSWDGRVVLENVSLARLNDEGIPEEPLLKVDEVRTNVAVSPLLHGKIVVNSVDVNGFSAHLVREADGSLNLPDFSKFAALPQSQRIPDGERRHLLAATAATIAGLPPIEIHQVNLNDGLLAVDDKVENLALEVGLDFLNIQGAGLDDPFAFAGRLLPYPGAANKGDFPFTGRVAMLKNGALDLDGEATIEAQIKAFTLGELAGKLGYGHLLQSGTLDGIVKAAYADRKARVVVSEMKVNGAKVGLDQDLVVIVPDSSFGVNAEFDPNAGDLTFSDFSLLNELNSLKANGWMRGVYALADGGLPTAGVDFSGVADFAKAVAYAEALNLGLEGLPEVNGSGSYFGNVSLPGRESSDPSIPVMLSVDFNDGELVAREPATGITANVKLNGVSVKSAARLGHTVELNSNVSFKNVPIDARVPQIGANSVNLTVNGGVAMTAAGEAMAVELRLQNTRASIPVTPWSDAMTLTSPETQLTYDLQRDRLNIAAMTFDINDGVKGGVKAATVTGILAGHPQGQADVELSTMLETVKKIFQPMIPDVAAKMAGSLRSATQVRLEGKRAEARIQAEVDNADVLLNLEPQAQAAAATPKTTIGLLASINLDNPEAITVQALEMNNSEVVLRIMEKNGHTLSGRFGATAIKLAGVVDAAGMRGDFSNLSVTGNGMSVILGQGSQQIAGLESGVMQIAAAAETHLQVPLNASGDFSVPALDAGIDNLVFYIPPEGSGQQRQNSDFGNIRAKLGVDGYLGEKQAQVINLRTAMLTAKPMAVNARGQVDLNSGTLMAQYAARLMPAGMGPLLAYLQLPPTLLDDAAVSGVLQWNGSQLDSKGNAQGRLRLATGEINPFEMAHDISASIDQQQKSLTVSIRRLDGNIKTASGESVATLAAQQSNLLLSRAGSKGLVDIRLNGAAEPTRLLALGLAIVLPGLRDVATMLNNAQASGVYNAWLQVRDKGPASVGVNMGGVWQGAALQYDNVPYLAESGKLSAALEGEFAFTENRISLSRVVFRSDSAAVQSEGTAQVLLTADADNNLTGVGNISVDFRYVLADLSKLPLAFPGAVPSDMALAGRIDGTFNAGGDIHDIRVSDGTAHFEGVRLVPGGTEITIPKGTANFNAIFSIVTPTPPNMAGTPYDVFRLFNIQNGQATLTGAQIMGRPVETLAGSFDLQDGVLNLKSGQIQVQGQGGGAIAASGTVDFKPRAPDTNMLVAIRNLPMSLVNQEIAEFFSVESGIINLPAQGQTFGVAFSGFSEDEILRTLRLSNFNFAAGPTVIFTGPLLNSELDKARGLMRQEVTQSGQSRRITFTSITGTATADGSGLIVIPSQAPINVIGDNTGDFRVQGSVRADHTMDLEFLIVGKLENIIGFTLPNLIPNLRQGTDEQKSRFMERLNQNAAKGHYKVRLSGPLERPDLSGIGEVALRFMTDIFSAAPAEIIGGVVNLGKDAPGAILGAAGAILNPENVTNPSNIIKAPQNLGRGIGRMFGVGGGNNSAGNDE